MKFFSLFIFTICFSAQAEKPIIKPLPQTEADFAVANPVSQNLLKDIDDQAEGTGTWGGGDSKLYRLTEEARGILSLHAQLLQKISGLNYDTLPAESKTQYLEALKQGLVETIKKSTIIFLSECEVGGQENPIVFEAKKGGTICVSINSASEVKKSNLTELFLQIHIEQVLEQKAKTYNQWLSTPAERTFSDASYNLMENGWNLSFPIDERELAGKEKRKCLYVEPLNEREIELKDFPRRKVEFMNESMLIPINVRQDAEGSIWIREVIGIAKCLP